MGETTYSRIQMRRRTADEWTALNEILKEGEIGVITDVSPSKIKIGDGIKTWEQLQFSADTSGISAGQSNAIPTTIPDPLIKIYNADSSGTYTNFGGLNVSSGDISAGLVQLRKNDAGVWSKVIVPIVLGAYVQKSNNPFGYYGPYASLALANAAISNTIVDGKNLRDGKIVMIGTSGNYITYSWKGGYADINLVEDAEIHARQTTDSRFGIRDLFGNTILGFLSNGAVAIAKFSQATEERIRKIVNAPKILVKDTTDQETRFNDLNSNTAWGILKNGSVALRFSQATVQRIRDIVKPMIPGSLNDKIFGKKLAIIGNSHSTNDGASGIGFNDTFIGQLTTLQGCTVNVNAVAGSNITYENSSSFTDDARWSSLSANSPDVIIIEGGTNDFLESSPLGSPGDTARTTFYGALYYLYNNIMAANPNARLFHMLPFHNTRLSSGVAIPETNGTYTLVQLYDAIRYTAKVFGVAIIDTSICGVNIHNVNLYSTDQLHFKEAGHKLLYKSIINETNKQL